MPKRPRFPLPFSGGLDRASGVAVERPDRFDDLRNCIPKEGKVEARKGLLEATGLVLTAPSDPASDVPFIGIFESENVSIMVGYLFGGGADNVEVFYAAPSGLNPISVDAWGTLTDAVPIPRVFGIDSYRKFFLAHDEDDVAQRLATVYVDDALALTTLQADLDGTGAKDVLFRGVARWGDYLLGWGFGSDSEKDRSEVVRISLPGQPTVFKPQYYFLAGAGSQDVLCCVPMGKQSALVFKPTEIYEIRGTNATNWGIDIRDARYGLAGSHLAVAVGGLCYFWSLEGPRLIMPGAPGEESQDIGVPLDLAGPSPTDLATEGDLAYGHAVYIPEDRIIEFNFPNRTLGKTRVYCLSIRDPQQPRWFYYERQVALACAGILFEGATGAPVGYPEITDISADGFTVTVEFDNIDAVGDETIEVWLSLNFGAYVLVQQIAVDGDAQSIVLNESDGIGASDDVSVALRYRRGIRYTDDTGGAGVYIDPVTGGWDSDALAQSVATITVDATPPFPTSVVWDACAEEPSGPKEYMYIGFRWTNAVLTGDTQILTRSGVDDASGATVAETVPVDGATDRVDHFGGWYVHPTSTVERYVWVRHIVDGIPSAAVKVVGSGPHGGWVPSAGCAL